MKPAPKDPQANLHKNLDRGAAAKCFGPDDLHKK